MYVNFNGIVVDSIDNSYFECVGCSFSLVPSLNNLNQIEGMFVRLNIYNPIATFEGSNSFLQSIIGKSFLKIPSVNIKKEDESVKVSLQESLPVTGFATFLVEHFLEGSLNIDSIRTNNCFVSLDSINKISDTSFLFTVKPSDSSKPSTVQIIEHAFQSGSNQSQESNIVRIDWIDTNTQFVVPMMTYIDVKNSLVNYNDIQGENSEESMMEIVSQQNEFFVNGVLISANQLSDEFDLCQINIPVGITGNTLTIKRSITDNLGGSFTTSKDIPLEIGGTNSRVLKINNTQCFEKSVKIVQPLFGEGTSQENYLANSNFNFEYILPIGNSIEIFYDLSQNKTLKTFNNNDFQCTGCIHTVNPVINNGETVSLYIHVVPALNNSSIGELSYQGNVIQSSDGNTLIFLSAKCVWRNYGVKLSLINEQPLDNFAEIKIESSFLNTEASLVRGDNNFLLLENASLLSSNVLGSNNFILQVVPEDPLKPSFVQLKEGFYSNASLRSAFSNRMYLKWSSSYNGPIGSKPKTKVVLNSSTISFEDTLSEDPNHEQFPITGYSLDINLKNGNSSTLVYSQSNNNSLDLCSLVIPNQITGNYILEINRSITNSLNAVSPVNTTEYTIFLDGATSKIISIGSNRCLSEGIVEASSYIGTSFSKDSYLKNPSTKEQIPSGSSVTIFYDFQGNYIHWLDVAQLNNSFVCSGCAYMQTNYLDTNNNITGLFVTVSPNANGNTTGILSMSNTAKIKSNSGNKILFPKIDLIWSDQGVSIATSKSYPLSNTANIIVETKLLGGSLKWEDIICDNCVASRNITQVNSSQHSFQVSPLDISQGSTVRIKQSAFKNTTQQSFASNSLHLVWSSSYQGAIGNNPYSEILVTKGYFSAKDTQGYTATNTVESFSGNYQVLTLGGSIIAQNNSGIDLCKELDLSSYSPVGGIQNLVLQRTLIQQGISTYFDKQITVLLGDNPLRVLSVDNYTCLEASNLVVTGKIHGGSLNPKNYHNNEIMMPLNQDTIIYYDFNGLEISSLPAIVAANFTCNNCSVTNVSNFPTTGDIKGVFITVKPASISTSQATLELTNNLWSTSGVKIYFKPKTINYKNQAVYLSHDDNNALVQKQFVRVSGNYIAADLNIDKIKENISANNCTVIDYSIVANNVILTIIPQNILLQSSIQVREGFFKNSLSELSFASNMLFLDWDSTYFDSVASVSIPEIKEKDGTISFKNIPRETADNKELAFSFIETKILIAGSTINTIIGDNVVDLCSLILPNNMSIGMHQLNVQRTLVDALGTSNASMVVNINVTASPLRVSQVNNFTCPIPQKVNASVSFGNGVFKDSYQKSSLNTVFNIPLGNNGIVYYDFNGKSVSSITPSHFSCTGCNIISISNELNSSNEIVGVFVGIEQLGLLPINGMLSGSSSLNLKSVDLSTIILPPQKIYWSTQGVKTALTNNVYPIIDYANISVFGNTPILNIDDRSKIISTNCAYNIIPNGLSEYTLQVVPNDPSKESVIQIEDAFFGNTVGSYASNSITLKWREPYTTQNTILSKGYLSVRYNGQEALLDYKINGVGETSVGPAINPIVSSTTTLEIGPFTIFSNTSADQYLDLCLTNVNTTLRGLQNIVAKKVFMDSSNQSNQLTHSFSAIISDGPDAIFSGVITQVGSFVCPKIVKKSPTITSFTRGASGISSSVLSFVEVRGAFNGQTCSAWGLRTIDLKNGANSIVSTPYNQPSGDITTTYSICKRPTTLPLGVYTGISAVRTINDCGGSISATIPNIAITVASFLGVNTITKVGAYTCP